MLFHGTACFLFKFFNIYFETFLGFSFSSSGQEFLSEVPPCVLDTFRIGSTEPSATLLMANEEFRSRKHRSVDCVDMIRDRLDVAITTAMEAATFVLDSNIQKELLYAAQFGKAFMPAEGGCQRIADK